MRKCSVPASCLGLAVVSLILLTGCRPPQSPPPPTEEVREDETLAAETGDPSLDFLGRQAGHGITQGLRGSGVVRFTPWETSLQASAFVSAEAETGRVRDRILALAEEAGAGTVISGAYYLEGEDVRFQTDVTDAVQGRLLGSPEAIVGARDAPG